jgi:hypothetical protein
MHWVSWKSKKTHCKEIEIKHTKKCTCKMAVRIFLHETLAFSILKNLVCPIGPWSVSHISRDLFAFYFDFGVFQNHVCPVGPWSVSHRCRMFIFSVSHSCFSETCIRLHLLRCSSIFWGCKHPGTSPTRHHSLQCNIYIYHKYMWMKMNACLSIMYMCM